MRRSLTESKGGVQAQSKPPGSFRAEAPEHVKAAAYRKICASLFLQQALYYQPFFSFGWVIFWMVWLFTRYFDALYYRDDDNVRTILISLWAGVEPIRIVAGYIGNLQEHLPWLIVYVILTMAPHHATTYYVLIASKDRTPVTNAVQVVQAVLLEINLLAGLHAVWKLATQKLKQYYLFESALEERRRAQASPSR
ncbi:hypothetical protein DUNSADRAFT_12124 [Dunaliella salina]|uniref:Transmembrane protein 17 n=1 Tax=Dunaliella salina TaxID=3046 RepID=A0ABQ7GBY1_DUNSA|nr:hypothetical protein DUNSADRAFT_12124 [Dunaliella salina]|eukprot:KAF5832113.1 hypothetical protein DUNSADRAFT_12124 [Dunaliella salina]